MKRKKIVLSLICFIVLFSCYGLISSNKPVQITDIALANIEALSNNENAGSDWWTQPETRMCKHELGGGWFESSVERICKFCATPNSCTPIDCGNPF